MSRRIAILGSTGSVGRAALDVLRHLRAAGADMNVAGLSALHNVALLAEQVREFRPAVAAVASTQEARALRAAALGWDGEILVGSDGLASVAAEGGDGLVCVAVVGIAGLRPTLAALNAGRDVALATKEALVAGGRLIREAASRARRRVLPIDSEHSAIFQCLGEHPSGDVARLWLTASGGPFRNLSKRALEDVSPAQALRHPTWSMGKKVTVDSATLMNKGLEIIEAHWLFGMHPDQIEVVIHPQSLVHSCVEFVDGSVLAQMGPRDMRLPIQYAMTYPRRVAGLPAPLDLRAMGSLEFGPPDPKRFPALGLAREALARGGTAPAALSAANEIAVQAFLDGRIGFQDITALSRSALEHHQVHPATSLEAVLAADGEARAHAGALSTTPRNSPARLKMRA
jgi:1-deoxy-D-xylulose-5-phosphate reductoisomerase